AREPVPTARMSPSGEPRRETQTLVRGTTGWVGGLRLGVGRIAEDAATLVILEGRNVPSQGNWRVSGEAGHSEELANGYTVTIERVTASADGSVTVTVTPPE
ncbi:hypothetical protein ACFQ07_26250, partial [Actinomadura adrarensis]